MRNTRRPASSTKHSANSCLRADSRAKLLAFTINDEHSLPAARSHTLGFRSLPVRVGLLSQLDVRVGQKCVRLGRFGLKLHCFHQVRHGGCWISRESKGSA